MIVEITSVQAANSWYAIGQKFNVISIENNIFYFADLLCTLPILKTDTKIVSKDKEEYYC